MRGSYINCFVILLIISLAPLSFAQVSTETMNSPSPSTIDDDQIKWLVHAFLVMVKRQEQKRFEQSKISSTVIGI